MSIYFIAGGARSGKSGKEGIVPMNALARQFRDLSGIMNQEFAAAVDQVFLMKFGIAMELK